MMRDGMCIELHLARCIVVLNGIWRFECFNIRNYASPRSLAKYKCLVAELVWTVSILCKGVTGRHESCTLTMPHTTTPLNTEGASLQTPEGCRRTPTAHQLPTSATLICKLRPVFRDPSTLCMRCSAVESTPNGANVTFPI
jgi:hypothetical protein